MTPLAVDAATASFDVFATLFSTGTFHELP